MFHPSSAYTEGWIYAMNTENGELYAINENDEMPVPPTYVALRPPINIFDHFLEPNRTYSNLQCAQVAVVQQGPLDADQRGPPAKRQMTQSRAMANASAAAAAASLRRLAVHIRSSSDSPAHHRYTIVSGSSSGSLDAGATCATGNGARRSWRHGAQRSRLLRQQQAGPRQLVQQPSPSQQQ